MIEMISKPANITRIVFKEVLAGDRRKFEAISNDDPSAGGGARDLRFSPYSKFGAVFERMFIDRDDNNVLRGHFFWIEKGKELSGDAFFHPPTTARPNEGRLANVDKYLPTDSLPAADDGSAILLFIQDDDKKVWPTFTTTQSLETDDWHAKVREMVLNCLHAKRRAGVATVGFIDFETKEMFCNG